VGFVQNSSLAGRILGFLPDEFRQSGFVHIGGHPHKVRLIDADRIARGRRADRLGVVQAHRSGDAVAHVGVVVDKRGGYSGQPGGGQSALFGGDRQNEAVRVFAGQNAFHLSQRGAH